MVGTVMRKIKSRTWKKQRYFKLQDDCMTIWYKSKKAGKAHSTCKSWGFNYIVDGFVLKDNDAFILRLHRDCSLSTCYLRHAFYAVSMSDVEVVREGHQSEVLLCIADEFPANRCFTVVFHGRRGNLDLVAESAEEAQSWIKGMRKLIENLENMGEREKLDQYPLFGVCFYKQHWLKINFLN